ncbi:hypothetical protein OSB04_030252 [Centaurea solstitialis]|uniref:Uncharacterized protein n=1 Tax=Centaurea solstitialis TaxID=347529 RepID=A0AA38S8F2_9ASTR|nr:hypothetical protein OSB04_030252 [Centaurea solstitialis]
MHCGNGKRSAKASARAEPVGLPFEHRRVFIGLPSAPNYTFVHEATYASRISFYDYIVVGGGTIGILVATTLSANASVLLHERGGSPYTNINVTCVENFGTYLFDTTPNSPSQRFGVEGVLNACPRVLGHWVVVLPLMRGSTLLVKKYSP